MLRLPTPIENNSNQTPGGGAKGCASNGAKAGREGAPVGAGNLAAVDFLSHLVVSNTLGPPGICSWTKCNFYCDFKEVRRTNSTRAALQRASLQPILGIGLTECFALLRDRLIELLLCTAYFGLNYTPLIRTQGWYRPCKPCRGCRLEGFGWRVTWGSNLSQSQWSQLTFHSWPSAMLSTFARSEFPNST